MFIKKFSILIIVICLISISTVGFAEDDLSITRWLVDSAILEDGGLRISEDLTFNFKDNFNGVYRNIVLRGTSGISDITLYEMVDSQEVEYSLDKNAKKGDKNVFKAELKKENYELMIFSPSSFEEKTFRIKYTLGDVSVVHKDTGELYYKFLGNENDTPVEYFSVIINLPGKNKDKTKIFAHGPSNGKIEFIEDDLIKLEASNIVSKDFIEARILFPKDWISKSTNTGNNTFNNIVDEELSFIKDIERKTASKERNKVIFNNISIVLTAVGIMIVGFITNKIRRNPDIYKQLNSLSPEDITPAELRQFYSQVIDSRSPMTTIFDLARKGYISIIEEEQSEKEETRFIFSKVEKSYNDLLSHELYILDWLFHTIGNGSTLSTANIEDYRKENTSKFNKEFLLWQSKVKSDLNNREYHDDSGKKPGGLMLIVSLVSFGIAIATIIFGGTYGIILMILGFLAFFYGISLFFRKSDKGYMEYKMWKDYKQDLNRKGKTPENYKQTIPKDKDLIYGLALGLPMKSMDNFRQNMPETYGTNHWIYWYFLTNPNGGSKFEDNFNSSFYGYATGTTSTSIGGGGGFSGGGGGGAGGGGAGGF
jgi:uncharacterized membrane protein